MKKTFVIVMLLISLTAFGQGESAVYKKFLAKRKYVEGYILMKDSSKLIGAVASPSGMLGEIKVVTKEGERKSVSFYNLLAYQRDDSYYESDGSLFYRLEKRGKNVSYYERIVTTSTPTGNGMSMTSSSTVKYFRKTGTMYFERVAGLTFANDMAKYFSDCQPLADRIKDKRFSYKNAEVLVNEYDKCILSN